MDEVRSLRRSKVRAASYAFLAVAIFGFSVYQDHGRWQMTPLPTQLANVASLSAAVAPNPYNTLAMQFDAKERELNAREQALDERTAALRSEIAEGQRAQRTIIWSLVGTVIMLILLLGLNFYLDLRRSGQKTLPEEHTAHDGELTTRL